ncbi:MAG: Rpn family recombination-promoting nuclease/putative transposase [Rickettsiales bacterium]|nr:Rpn family recombination-promoting nuclease/putative transposase [Rickettsiales bacterium]
MVEVKEKSKKSTKYEMTHDKLFKTSMANPTIAKETLQMILPKEILDAIELNSLKLEKSDFANVILGDGTTDVLFSVKWNNEKGYIFVILEHQTEPDKLMTFRLMKYALRICDLYLSQNKGAKFPLIFPCVIYSGHKSYTAPRAFWEMFQNPQQAKKYLAEPPHLLSLKDIEDINTRYKCHAGLVLMLMNKVHEQDIFPYLKEWFPLLTELAHMNLHVTEDLLKYLIRYGDSKSHKELMQLFAEAVPEKYIGNIMTIGDRLRQDAIEQVALNMLANNIEIDTISIATKLSFAEIEGLKKSLVGNHDNRR